MKIWLDLVVSLTLLFFSKGLHVQDVSPDKALEVAIGDFYKVVIEDFVHKLKDLPIEFEATSLRDFAPHCDGVIDFNLLNKSFVSFTHSLKSYDENNGQGSLERFLEEGKIQSLELGKTGPRCFSAYYSDVINNIKSFATCQSESRQSKVNCNIAFVFLELDTNNRYKNCKSAYD